MMPIIEIVWFMVAVLPALILMEGYDMFVKLMNEKNSWWRVPYFLLATAIIILIILLLLGYR